MVYQPRRTYKKIDEVSKVLSHDYRKLWTKHHIYTLHKIINNKIEEKASEKYKSHTQQQIDKIANEIENIRQQEGKTRQQQIENEAIVFANQYR